MNNKINDATMRIKQSICIYAFAALLLGGCKSNNELTIPTNLRTEYLTEPYRLGYFVSSLYMGILRK